MKGHTIQLRVRYEETDQMGVVYYSKYLVWFEIARTEFFREKGVEYRRIEEEDKVFIPVVEAYCRYRASLRYDDLVDVTTKLAEVGKTRVVFEYEVTSGGKVKATGRTSHAFVDKDGAPIPVPDKIRKALSV